MAQDRRLITVDALRGIAVLAVLITHLPFSRVLNPSAPDTGGANSVLPAWLTDITAFGGYGVNLFLVISGFCIHLAYARGRQLGFRDFWWRRIHRLYPPYVAAVALSLAGLFLYHGLIRRHLSLPGALGYSSMSRLWLDLGSLVVQAQNITGAGAHIGNSPLWTLALEEQLYALYFVLLALRKRLGWPGVLAVVAVVTLGWRTVVVVTHSPGWWLDLAPARWLEWTLGALSAELYTRRTETFASLRSPLVAIGGVALAVALVLTGLNSAPHLIAADCVFGVAFFAALSWWLVREQSSTWQPTKLTLLMRRLGLFSYSVYLTHSPIFFAAKQVGLRAAFGTGGVLLLRLTAALVGGFIFFFAVERRFLRPRGEAVPALATS